MRQLANISWSDAAANSKYPLDDRASCLSDDGTPLPPDILVDAIIRYEGDQLVPLRVAAITISPRVSTILVCTSPDDGPSQAIAFANIIGAVPWKTYPLESLVSGIAGWVSFGPGVQDNSGVRSWSFSTAAQGRLLDRCGVPFSPGRVRTFKVAEAVTGISGPLSLKSSDGSLKVTIKKVDVPNQDGTTSTVDGVFVGLDLTEAQLSKYIGPCDVRPESGNCRKSPIYDIANVSPGADGIVTIKFSGPVTPVFVNGRLFVQHDGTQAEVCLSGSSPIVATPAPACGDGLPSDEQPTPCTRVLFPLPPGSTDPLTELGPFTAGIIIDSSGQGSLP